MDWHEFIGLPAFVINLDRRSDRLALAMQRLESAGFRQVIRFRAVDGTDAAEVAEVWRSWGCPKMDPSDETFCDGTRYPGKQGCTLSHLKVWRHIVENNIPMALIFEDDVLFHPDWDRLGPVYLKHTPPDFDVIYMGLRFGIPPAPKEAICRAPLMCLHAYAVTLHGAKFMIRILNEQPRGIRTVDMLLCDYHYCVLKGDLAQGMSWWGWNATMFNRPHDRKGHEDWIMRNSGLVFQDESMGTDIMELRS
jgi:GR25 family glycosyltransferase involved in LPS biosynthesis